MLKPVKCIFLMIFLLCSISVLAQINLRILDEENSPLTGVQGILNDNYVGISDDNGELLIPQYENGSVLNLIYLGFKDLSVVLDEDTSNELVLYMTVNDFLLDEILLIGRSNEKILDLPYQVDRIDSREIRSSQAQTSADLLEKNSAVYVQKSQMGGGSPILRGFEANKILLVIDGVRLNNAIYRNGHLQNAITIDHNSLASAEVIFGPGSLSYGSDAIGGVVHYRTKSPKLNTSKNGALAFEGSLSSRYSSANNEKRSHFEFNLGGEKLASYTSIGIVDFDDLKTGRKYDERYPDFGKRLEYVERINGVDQIINNEQTNLQVGTAYSQYDLLQKFKYQLNDHAYLLTNVQYSNSSDIPRYDQLTDKSNGQFRYSEWFYGPQQRFLISPSFHYSGNKKLFDELILITAYQKINEERNTREFNSEWRYVQEEKVDVYSFSLDLKKRFFENQKINYGIEWQYNEVNSLGFEDSFSNEIRSAISRYPSGGSNLSTGGIYLHQQIEFPKLSLKWHHGIRYSLQSSSFEYLLTDPFNWPDFYYDGFKNNNGAFTWMNAFSYELNKKWNVRWSLASAFRAPNIDDLAKVRIKSNEISIPNPNIKPESTTNTDLSINYTARKLQLEVTLFYSKLKDAIIRQAGTLPNGENVFLSNNDSLFVTQNFNAENAKVYGLTGSFNYSISKSIKFGSSISYTKGRSFDVFETESPLAHIPPLFGRGYVSWNKNKIDLRAEVSYNGAKPLDEFGGSADNPELATPEGSLAWQSYNFYASYQLAKSFTVSAAVENIFDLHYRNFASGVSAPGRNFILSARYIFD